MVSGSYFIFLSFVWGGGGVIYLLVLCEQILRHFLFKFKKLNTTCKYMETWLLKIKINIKENPLFYLKVSFKRDHSCEVVCSVCKRPKQSLISYFRNLNNFLLNISRVLNTPGISVIWDFFSKKLQGHYTRSLEPILRDLQIPDNDFPWPWRMYIRTQKYIWSDAACRPHWFVYLLFTCCHGNLQHSRATDPVEGCSS